MTCRLLDYIVSYLKQFNLTIFAMMMIITVIISIIICLKKYNAACPDFQLLNKVPIFYIRYNVTRTNICLIDKKLIY